MDNSTGVENVPAELEIVPLHVPAIGSVMIVVASVGARPVLVPVAEASMGTIPVPIPAAILKAISSWKSSRGIVTVLSVRLTVTEPRIVVPSLVL